MPNLSLTLTSSTGAQRALTLTGRRASVALWAARGLPTGHPLSMRALVCLARLLGAREAPEPPQYATAEEAESYHQGFSDGFHDEPMASNPNPNAYTRGFWEGKR